MAGVKNNDKLTLRDVKILLSAGLLLGTVFIKTSNQLWAYDLKTKIVHALSGGISAEKVIEAAGQSLDDGGLQSVFEVITQEKTENDNESVQVYAESAFAEDLLVSRVQSMFPKQVDETAYLFDFETCMPVDGVKTSEYGERIHPISGEESFHYGVDYGADEGVKIVSFADGAVRETGESSSYGNYVIVDHDEGISSLYAHCSSVDVKEGDKVSAGDKIAEVGATGAATGNHLHFELWRDGKTLDPTHYLTE